jgi:RHH-type rel operon transcriptional repressor/antitoxin RelB
MRMRPLSKQEGYDHRIPTAMARLSRYGTINLIDMCKTESAKFPVSVKTATKHRLEKLAKIVDGSSFLATESISEYLDVKETEVSGIKDAIASLDRGEAVAHECANG